MDPKNVKNTIIRRSLGYLAPDLCIKCGVLGAILCAHCKYDIEYEMFHGCIVCLLPSDQGVCQHHDTPYERVWVVGERRGILLSLLNIYKFSRVDRAADLLAELLDRRVPEIPLEAVVVPIPTARSNIRQRGYDHCLMIARAFARRRGLTLMSPLESHTNSTQHFLSRSERRRQAEHAFSLVKEVDPTRPHLVVDDIVTTGSTLTAATKVLRSAGVLQVWATAIARQPLD